MIDSFKLTDSSNLERKTFTDYPIIDVPKDDFILGDFNNDAQIDDTDFNLLKDVMGTDYLSKDWNRIYDLNNDYIIDLNDLIVFSKYYKNS